ncbi:MFS transporter [Sphingomonas sp. SRS2]|uniref:MFS transporter n=1 Tax=Sphingomonas sp. SRS2 TaxID=133190 RepID=UPI0006184E15|nr:MFS transporter [Sphingomonas sp. SRS2]KKC24566.1 hypothetical protein WP12_18535 [Sphingomonas sp. SRS2]
MLKNLIDMLRGDVAAGPGRRYPIWAVLVALLLAEITGAYETAMIFSAIGDLVETFGSPISVGWLITIYLLVGAGTAAVIGRLGDIYGRRFVMLILLAIGVLGSVISASTSIFAVVLLGRALQGLTGAILPLCIGLIWENMSREKAPSGIGLMIAGNSAGSAIGLIFGGLIVDHYSWRGIFVASAVFAAFSFVAVLACVPRSPTRFSAYRIDWLSVCLLMPSIMALLLVISNGSAWGWLDPKTICMAILSILAFVWLIRHSLHTPDPLIDVRLFADRRVLIANLVTALTALGASQAGLVFLLLLQAPLWTGVGLGMSATAAGMVKLPSNLIGIVAGPWTGQMIRRFGHRWVMVLGGVLMTLGWLLIIAFHSSVIAVVSTLCLITLGTIVVLAVVPNVIATAAPDERTSEATSVTMTLRQTFYGMGAQIIAVVLASDTIKSATGGAGYPTERAFVIAMVLVSGVCLTATMAALFLPGRPTKSAKLHPVSGVGATG